MPISILLAVGQADFEPAVVQAAQAARLAVVRRCVDVSDLLAAAATRQADLAVVASRLPGLDVEVLQRLRDEGLAVVGATSESSGADSAALRALGVSHLVSADLLDEFADVVAEAVANPDLEGGRTSRPAEPVAVDPTQPRQTRGRVVAVWGPTGAPGRTTVATGLSAALAGLGAPTLLVDADVYGGSVAQMLGLLDESSGLLAAARDANSGNLDPTRLAAHARAVGPHLRVLTGLPRADRWTEVSPVLLSRLVEAARSLSAFTVLDCGFSLELDEELSYDTAAPRRNGATLTALDLADTVVVVGRGDPVGLSRLVRGLHELGEAVPATSPVVVVNRYRSGLGWSGDEIRSTLARTASATSIHLLPDDAAACDKATMLGRTLVECAPESVLLRAVTSLARELAGLPPSRAKGRRFARHR